MLARGAIFILGIWLSCSVFLWPHAASHGLNALICGALVALLSLLAEAVWIISSLGIFPDTDVGTFWNNLLVGMVVLTLALSRPTPVSRDPILRDWPPQRLV